MNKSPPAAASISVSAVDTNDMLYQAMMRNKQQEETRAVASAIATERSVSQLKRDRQKEAEDVVSVVASSLSISYSTNTKYIHINSGKDPAIDVSKTLHPLSPDECDVYTSLTSANSRRMVAMPNHCVNAVGELEGFKFVCKKSDVASAMPISRRTFFRTSMAEYSQLDNELNEAKEILKLLQNKEKIKYKFAKLARRIYLDSVGAEANFDCIPESTDSVHGKEGNSVLVGSFLTHKMADCREWKPELPDFFGVFHAYVRSFNRDSKEHKLFLITSGGCSVACDSFFNLHVDAGPWMTAEQVHHSEEAWYLRKMCQRNNAKIILEIAKELKLNIQSYKDVHGYTGEEMLAHTTTETMHCDIYTQDSGSSVVVTNGCSQTTGNINGVLCNMHPSEGVWLFKGPLKGSTTMKKYGGSFGNDSEAGVFPAGTTLTHKSYPWTAKNLMEDGCKRKTSKLVCRDSSSICRVDSTGIVVEDPDGSVPSTYTYTMADEAFLSILQKLRWNRDDSYIELMPIAVVHVQN